MAFHIERNDITLVEADAIVNTANPKPTYGGGTDAAIYKAAGEKELLEARRKIGDIKKGQAVETPAFRLKAKYIIHTVGPEWKDGKSGELDILRTCYRNSLELAKKLKCRSIAFPLISTGVYGVPKDKALQTAISEIQSFLMEHTMKVTLVVFGNETLVLSGKLFDNIQKFVDDNYVMNAWEREYYIDNKYLSNLPPKEIELIRKRRGSLELGRSRFQENKKPGTSAVPETKPVKKYPDGPSNIKDMLEHPEKTFRQKLFEIMDERKLTAPDVYKKATVSKAVFSKIVSNKDYHPTKGTAIKLSMALQLDLEATKDLIGRAGWTLSPSKKEDLIVTWCIMNGQYNVVYVNIMLDEYGVPLIEDFK